MENLEYLAKKGESLKRNKNLEALQVFFSQKELSTLSKRSIAIVGTNGKTSTASHIFEYLKNPLRKNVVKFTSPHLVQVNERIESNTGYIHDSELINYIEEVKRFEEKEKLVLGYFESLFLVSCKYFLDLDSDFFVVEAGIGGRLDTTSIINSETVVLTNVGLDHTDILGESIDEILKEKIHISNRVKKLFVGELFDTSYINLIKAELDLDSASYNAPCLASNSSPDSGEPYMGDSEFLDFRNRNIHLARRVIYDKFGRINYPLPSTSPPLSVEVPGRFHIINSDPNKLKIVDGAHNGGATSSFLLALDYVLGDNLPSKIECFLGIKNEKDYQGIIDALAAFSWIDISLLHRDTFRGQLEPSIIAQYLTNLGMKFKYASLDDFHSYNDPSILLGSLYLVGEYIKEFR